MTTIAEMLLQFVVFNERPRHEEINRIFEICRAFPRVRIPTYEDRHVIKMQYVSYMKSAVQYGMRDYLLLTLVIANEQFLSVYCNNVEICRMITILFNDILL